MSRSHDTGASDSSSNTRFQQQSTQRSEQSNTSEPLTPVSVHSSPPGCSPKESESRSSTVYPHASRRNQSPRLLQPFFSLRVQLTFIYSLLLALMIVGSSTLIYKQSLPLYSMLFALGTIILGSILAFLFTTILLRPLARLTDATQAVASGDLEQRVRLPLRLPPQDEIDRLSGCINEMAKRIEHAENMQGESQELFRRFFSDASHQLRTPLTSIRGFTELLIRGAKDDPEMGPRILIRLKDETERMTNLINNLLTLARLEDKHPLKFQYLDLLELAVEEIERTRARANDERMISLLITTEERLGVQADRDRIKQLLFILLDNALKYGRSAPDGTIFLQMAKEQQNIIISVIDNGEGITPEDQEHIFEAFYRGHSRTSSSATPGSSTIGAGLGLTIASAIVRAHSGAITVYSERGKGTEFRVTLPGVD